MNDMKDAGRSAVSIVRMLRGGDTEAVQQLCSTLDDSEKSALCGSLAALANAALTTLDDVCRQYGLPGHRNSDEVLAMMQAGFASDDA